MNYTKAALSFAEQADLLIGRGLAAERAQLISTLERVSYYRLSGYWHPFRQAESHRAKSPCSSCPTIRRR